MKRRHSQPALVISTSMGSEYSMLKSSPFGLLIYFISAFIKPVTSSRNVCPTTVPYLFFPLHLRGGSFRTSFMTSWLNGSTFGKIQLMLIMLLLILPAFTGAEDWIDSLSNCLTTKIMARSIKTVAAITFNLRRDLLQRTIIFESQGNQGNAMLTVVEADT